MALSSEKLLNEFAVRLNKSKTQMTDACSQVENLRKEAAQLQKQLALAQQELEESDRNHAELKAKFEQVKQANSLEQERYLAEQAEVKSLRKKKAELTRKKELQEKECQKLSNEV